jgi:hypothetical protein
LRKHRKDDLGKMKQLPDESLCAFATFKKYVAMGDKRSIRALCRKHGKDRATCEKWSKKYQWQKRLRQLELEDCQRAIEADEQAKLNVAEERAREQMKFQQRALEASKRATERGLQILKQSAKGSKPSDAARLLAVGDAIGRAALGLSGESTAQTGHFGLRPTAPPNIVIRISRDEQGKQMDLKTIQFLREHPEHGQARRGSWTRQLLDAAHGEGWSERMLNGGSSGVAEPHVV